MITIISVWLKLLIKFQKNCLNCITYLYISRFQTQLLKYKYCIYDNFMIFLVFY